MPPEHEQLFQQVRLPRPRRHEPRNPWAMHGMQWMYVMQQTEEGERRVSGALKPDLFD